MVLLRILQTVDSYLAHIFVMMRERKTLALLFLLLLCSISWHTVAPVEWSCEGTPETTGEFGLSNDCTLENQVIMDTGDMRITGRPTLTTIKAAKRNRHFVIVSATLTIKWLNLTGGGNMNAEGGGSIYLTGTVESSGQPVSYTHLRAHET